MRRVATFRHVVVLIAVAALFATAMDAHAQQLTVTGSLSGVTPTVADFISGGTNLGTSKTAGVLTLNLSSCKKNTSCTIKISATTVPATGALRWALTNAGVEQDNVNCVAGSPSSAALTTTPATVLVCTLGNGSNNQGVSGVQVTFSYPVSWTGTPFGTYTTSGITFTLSTP